MYREGSIPNKKSSNKILLQILSKTFNVQRKNKWFKENNCLLDTKKKIHSSIAKEYEDIPKSSGLDIFENFHF